MSLSRQLFDRIKNTDESSVHFVEDITPYEVADPVIGPTRCSRCGRAYFADPDRVVSIIKNSTRFYAVCNDCLLRLELLGTVEGRVAVDFWVELASAPAYQGMEFNRFDVSGPYADELARARDKVIRWTQDVEAGGTRSFYLYSPGGEYGSGSGNGKTSLLWCGFKYIARRLPGIYSTMECVTQVNFDCYVLHPYKIVQEFLSNHSVCEPGNYPAYWIVRLNDVPFKGTFNEYLEALLQRRVIFVDDIGQGPTNGMFRRTTEEIIERRAQICLPTFYTSNYSLEQLAKRIGDRAVSRIMRNGCDVHELQAPDYMRVRSASS